MHELSIAVALIDQAASALAGIEHPIVDRLTVRVGALSGVDLDALRFAFPLAAEGSTFASAELLLEATPAVVRCAACGALSSPPLPLVKCAACGCGDVEISAGRELVLQRVELRTTAPPPAGPALNDIPVEEGAEHPESHHPST